MRTLRYGVLFVSILSLSNAAYIALRNVHDYVKDGRPVDGDFPSTLDNVPYYCYQAPSRGTGELNFITWFFDITRRQCMRMLYSGTGGNENRFESEAECNHHCGRKRKV